MSGLAKSAPESLECGPVALLCSVPRAANDGRDFVERRFLPQPQQHHLTVSTCQVSKGFKRLLFLLVPDHDGLRDRREDDRLRSRAGHKTTPAPHRAFMVMQLVSCHTEQPPPPIGPNRHIINSTPRRQKHIRGRLNSFLTFQATQEECENIRLMLRIQRLKLLLPTHHKATNSIMSVQHVQVHQKR
jgi:hypothetical protein